MFLNKSIITISSLMAVLFIFTTMPTYAEDKHSNKKGLPDLKKTVEKLQVDLINIELTPGPQGLIGAAGEIGQTGPVGPVGKSIQGPRGLTGPEGPMGESIIGIQGPEGQVGPAGPQGEPGSTAPSAVVYAEDYVSGDPTNTRDFAFPMNRGRVALLNHDSSGNEQFGEEIVIRTLPVPFCTGLPARAGPGECYYPYVYRDSTVFEIREDGGQYLVTWTATFFGVGDDLGDDPDELTLSVGVVATPPELLSFGAYSCNRGDVTEQLGLSYPNQAWTMSTTMNEEGYYSLSGSAVLEGRQCIALSARRRNTGDPEGRAFMKSATMIVQRVN
jgi:hypothetical protein